ncbi:MAG: anthranilate synthase component I family protein, partial [Chlamydiia bacterium]|nr:anthranilate synthase component I family protein [Chlamydiia bacterium]
GTLETRPIKGTMPRGVTPEEDRQNMHQLLQSEKERSELLMITDLMRNDLAKISIPGTVATEKIWQCEAYTNVFHLLSIITSALEPSVHPVDAVRSCFPAGSITGCPKLRSMEAIAAIEKRRRGIYTGAIGYFAGNGDFDFNVAIRTLSCSRDQVDLQLGGAVVIDSDPDKEYDETLYKGESLFKALGCCI